MSSSKQKSFVAILVTVSFCLGLVVKADAAEFCRCQGREDIQKLYEGRLAEIEKESGATNLDYASICRLLADLELSCNCMDRAEQHLEQAIAIRERLKEASTPSYASDLEVLASIKAKQKNYAGAEKLYKQALKIYMSDAAAQLVQIYRTTKALSAVEMSQGKFKEAEMLLQERLSQCQHRSKEECLLYAGLMCNLADLLKKTGKSGAATDAYSQAIMVRGKLLGANHPEVAAIKKDQAFLYLTTNNFVQAESIFKELYQAAKASKATVQQRECGIAYAMSLRRQGKAAQAKIIEDESSRL